MGELGAEICWVSGGEAGVILTVQLFSESTV